jgi:hypothetical protein
LGCISFHSGIGSPFAWQRQAMRLPFGEGIVFRVSVTTRDRPIH